MAGLSLPAFRKLVMELGCGLAYSEMVSAEGVVYANNKTKRYYENAADVRPYGVQLFTAKPEFLAKAIERIDDESIDVYDINMGCPVKKVVKKGAGAALMKEPLRAAQLVEVARRATSKPVTVKIRAGWDESSINCVEIARVAEESGADAVIVHPRTRAQEFRGSARWELIGEVKAAVRIPVMGNGDIATADDARRMMAETGCDAVMIGRAAYRNPWIFAELSGMNAPASSPAAKRELLLRYIDLLREDHDERGVVCAMRQFLARFSKGYRDVSKFLTRVHSTNDVPALKEAIRSFAFSALR